ncbi:hypothetical protein HNY73_003261 [Argiope bruennichi]|uniref:Uncharacterized protein n=1 Tax=Argiope bruennichi TaxID=94029 RepID=A0A8T0G0D6_ARGBR|nr:hypothetical protein HNY73_003261 [Argiope bruennichi]
MPLLRNSALSERQYVHGRDQASRRLNHHPTQFPNLLQQCFTLHQRAAYVVNASLLSDWLLSPLHTSPDQWEVTWSDGSGLELSLGLYQEELIARGGHSLFRICDPAIHSRRKRVLAYVCPGQLVRLRRIHRFLQILILGNRFSFKMPSI